jgi:hypothetical protein
MKTLSLFAVLAITLIVSQSTISSCTKTVTKTVTVTDTVTNTVTDTVTKYAVNNSVANLLFGKQWIVDTLYNGYSASNAGTIAYIRGGSGNTENLDNYSVIFWADGNQFFTNSTNNSYSIFPYSFRSADSTNFVVNNPSPDYGRIITLTLTRLVIYDSTGSGLSFYVYKP